VFLVLSLYLSPLFLDFSPPSLSCWNGFRRGKTERERERERARGGGERLCMQGMYLKKKKERVF
jgi:hypothetical protein